MSEIIRSGESIASEINQIKKETAVTCLQSAIAIGKLLVEAKETVPYGSWGDWLKDNVDYSVSTANNLMKLFNTYGEQAQLSFEDSVTEIFACLTPSQALVLSALPEEQRAEFVQNNDVENESVRQLQKKVDELLGKSKKDAETISKLRDEKKKAQENSNDLKSEVKQAEQALEAARKRETEATEKFKAAEARVEEIARELNKLQASDGADVEKLRSEYEAELAEYKKKLLKALAAETQKFSVHFDIFQSEFNALKAMLDEFGDRENAAKLRSALLQALDVFKSAVEDV